MGRKIRSPVWDYFTKAYGGSSRSKASCNACLTQVLFGGNTTNPTLNLRLNNSAIYSKIHSSSNKKPQMTICPTMAGLFAKEDCSRDSIVSQSSDHAATGNQIIRFTCTIFVMLFYTGSLTPNEFHSVAFRQHNPSSISVPSSSSSDTGSSSNCKFYNI